MSITGYDPGRQEPSRTFPDRIAGQFRDPVRGPHASACQVVAANQLSTNPLQRAIWLIDRLWPPSRFRPRSRPDLWEFLVPLVGRALSDQAEAARDVGMTDMPILDEIGSIVDRLPSAGTSSFASCRQSPHGASWRPWPEEPLQPAAQDSHLQPGRAGAVSPSC
jgi:hypothetical protein